MKMQQAYGIFDDEADHIIGLVRRRCPLDQVRDTGCPACGAAMAVEFAGDGTWFQVSCEGDPLHISKHQDIVDPPPWWRECVSPTIDVTFYWREAHAFDGDGNLTMYASGCRANGVHWSGQLECSTGDPDYAFWRWVLVESGCTSDLISDTELERLRARFGNTV
jgi:hypothetical protein